jgi:hypothetical protein
MLRKLDDELRHRRTKRASRLRSLVAQAQTVQPQNGPVLASTAVGVKPRAGGSGGLTAPLSAAPQSPGFPTAAPETALDNAAAPRPLGSRDGELPAADAIGRDPAEVAYFKSVSDFVFRRRDNANARRGVDDISPDPVV